MEPILQPSTKAFVHHIILYTCYHRPGEIEQFDESQGDICYGGLNKPWKQCDVTIAGWTLGESRFSFPQHLGYPLDNREGVLVLKLEIHYNNPQLTKGAVDSSGMRLWLTKSLRQYDAGVFYGGMKVTPIGHILPAGYPSLRTHGHCSEDCLTEAMGSAPEIYVFGVTLHAHLLGTGVRVHHYRDGVEKAYLGSDLAYDFNYQQTRLLAQEITIKKGDNLVVECFYNTAAQKNATFGGHGTAQEMCLAYFHYYPLINLISCTSVPTQANMAEHLSLTYERGQGYSRAKITEGPYSNKTLNQFFEAIGKLPDQETMDKYQEAMTTGKIVQSCTHLSQHTTHFTQVPKVVSPYKEEARQCSGAICHQPPGGMILMMLCSCGLLLILATKLTTN